MDSGPSIKNEKKLQKPKNGNTIPNDGNVLQSIWLRRDSNYVNEINRILLWSQLGFILPCGVLLWIILLIFG
jgi:hypothetical protein